MEPVDLKDIVDGIADLYEPLIEDEGGRLETDVPDGLQAEGQKDLISQVLVNLINNAVDAMLDQDNREICIEIGPAEGNKAGRLAVTVSDIGPGLKEPEKVFDPFYSTKAVGAAGGEEGMGLGLSISYGLVQSFGGNIRGRNGAQGAEFAVELEGWKAEEDRK